MQETQKMEDYTYCAIDSTLNTVAIEQNDENPRSLRLLLRGVPVIKILCPARRLSKALKRPPLGPALSLCPSSTMTASQRWTRRSTEAFFSRAWYVAKTIWADNCGWDRDTVLNSSISSTTSHESASPGRGTHFRSGTHLVHSRTQLIKQEHCFSRLNQFICRGLAKLTFLWYCWVHRWEMASSSRPWSRSQSNYRSALSFPSPSHLLKS